MTTMTSDGAGASRALTTIEQRGYFYRGGVEWRAVTSWAGGIAAGYLLLGLGVSGLARIVTFVVSAAPHLALGGARGMLRAPAVVSGASGPTSTRRARRG